MVQSSDSIALSRESVMSPESEKLLERLSDPSVSQGLNRLLDRLDTMTMVVETLDEFLRRGDTIADNVASLADEVRRSEVGCTKELLRKTPQYLQTGEKIADAACAMDVDELSRSNVLQRLTEPATLEAINNLLDRLPLIAFLTNAFEGFLNRGETFTENLSSVVSEFKLREIDPQKINQTLESIPKIREAVERLFASGLLDDGMQQLFDAGILMTQTGMLDPKVVKTLGELGKLSTDTYREVKSQPVQPVGGLFAMMRATKDPDVQKTIGFAFAFAKAFGKNLK